MARDVFVSFHYSKDAWRVQQIINIDQFDGTKLFDQNDWEDVKRKSGGIEKWINNEIANSACTIVLIGEDTADRKWVKYEINESIRQGKGLIGIYIHNLKDEERNVSSKGDNPFVGIDSNIPVFTPKADDAYDDIKNNIQSWIEKGIRYANDSKRRGSIKFIDARDSFLFK